MRWHFVPNATRTCASRERDVHLGPRLRAMLVNPRVFQRLAEAKPMARSRPNEALGFPCRPIRDARSAEWELMSPLSLAQEHTRARIPRSH
jgi:hypothetical protein